MYIPNLFNSFPKRKETQPETWKFRKSTRKSIRNTQRNSVPFQNSFMDYAVLDQNFTQRLHTFYFDAR